ncbi:hypothetical protein ABZV31_32030 [Streptomyces sp. NPDC005202]|uniref:hypothetical protein n=1 Tax=Streptomyces sp. NPDC005202 TaxID=3157021 RepID=UPI0033B64871
MQEADFVMGALLRRFPAERIPPGFTGLVDAWITAHVPQQDFTFLSTWVLRKQLMSPTIFRALLSWARTHPDSEDLIPRMASAACQVNPYVASREDSRIWLRTVELCLDHAERHGAAANISGALDALICQLALQFRTGVGAAWADDCIQRWLALPFSMDCHVFHPVAGIVGRCHSLVLSGRLDKAEAKAVGERLRRWVSRWAPGQRNDEALAFIDARMLPDPRRSSRQPNVADTLT